MHPSESIVMRLTAQLAIGIICFYEGMHALLISLKLQFILIAVNW